MKYQKITVEKKDGTFIPADEPVFLLRAQDILAPAAVDYYADLVESTTGDKLKAEGIRDIAEAMVSWTPRKLPD